MVLGSNAFVVLGSDAFMVLESDSIVILGRNTFFSPFDAYKIL